MNLYEIIFNITREGQYKSFLSVFVEENIGQHTDEKITEDEAIEKAFEYAKNVLGIEQSELQLNLIDLISITE